MLASLEKPNLYLHSSNKISGLNKKGGFCSTEL